VAGIVSFYHLMYRECVERAGGNPIDNRNTVYSGFEPEGKFNESVPRYAAVPKGDTGCRAFMGRTSHSRKNFLKNS
jgi:hypothetical protein